MAQAQLNVPIGSGLLDVFRVGVGPYGGLRLRFSDDASSLFTGAWTYQPGQRPRSVYEAHGSLRVQYTDDFALGLEGALFPRSASLQATSYLYF